MTGLLYTLAIGFTPIIVGWAGERLWHRRRMRA